MTQSKRDLLSARVAAALDESKAKALLESALQGKIDDLHALLGARRLSHQLTCRAIVALWGFDLLFQRPVRQALLASLDDSFAMELASELDIRSGTGILNVSNVRAALNEMSLQQGGWRARILCEYLSFPPECSGRANPDRLPATQAISPYVPMPPLHDYQRELVDKTLARIQLPGGPRAMLALPTGAGKTRVVMEALLSWPPIEGGENCFIWVAQHDELCEQAIVCLAQLWSSSRRPDDRQLRLQRVWGSKSHEVDWTVDAIVGTPESLGPRLRQRGDASPRVVAACVIDEAHLATSSYYEPLFKFCALQAVPMIGVSATPAGFGGSSLTARFDRKLIHSESLGPDAVRTLRERGVLSEIRYREVSSDLTFSVTENDIDPRGHDFSAPLLDRLGRDRHRNGKILEALLALPVGTATLCFTSSVAGARILAAAICLSGRTGAVIDASTPQQVRSRTISAFRSGELQFLFNCQVLATGFDAPNVACLVIARPTRSPVLLEQMIGRGLRGPANGGTEFCELLWVEDDFDGQEELRPLSYQRFMTHWR